MKQSQLIKIVQLALVCSLGSSCALETGDEEATESIHQESNVGWNTHGVAAATVGMSDSGSEGFQWLNNGLVCRAAPITNPCSGSILNYSAPDNNFAAIRGVGRARNTGHIYAWYSDSTVTEGTAENLTAFSSAKRPFATPFKHNSSIRFSMVEMVEADNSDNGEWYYYWKDFSTNTFWRTTGSSVSASSGSVAQQVTVAPGHGDIVGFAFGPGSPAHAETFYADGTLNISNTSLDLSN